MTMHATSSFVIDRWEETIALEETGAKFVRTSIGKTFTGDIVGTSKGEMTMAHASPTSAAYCGFERFSVTLGGRNGGFTLHHNASAHATERSATWEIMPDSGTGDLANIRGTSTITRHEDGSHTFTLDYDFG
jgi:hypothetical protein